MQTTPEQIAATWPAVEHLRERDPLNHDVGPGSTWTTVNAAEALPGVLTPLGASFFLAGAEVGIHRCFHELGVLSASEARLPARADDRLSGVHLGRYAANLDSLRAVADRTPGTSGDALERQAFGSVRPGLPKVQGSAARYPAIVLKGPRTAWRLRGRMLHLADELDRWWLARTSEEIPSLPLARRGFDEALRGFAVAMAPHFIATMVVQGLLDRLRAVSEEAGLPGHELLVSGGGVDLEEVRLVQGLLRVASGTGTLDPLIREFGFQGPDAGELSSRSWREDPEPLRAMVAAYGRLDGFERGSATQRRADRDDARRELLAALPRGRRELTRVLIRMSTASLPLREVGKGSFLRGIDVARHAAREAGRHLAAEGRIDHPDDVFLLAAEELADGPSPAARDRIDARREQRRRLFEVRLPELWSGRPEGLPIAVDGPADAVDELSGIGASAGIVTARARVVRRAAGCDALEPGEVLVCPITDPSWAAAFPLASALVTDVGGAVSHGAIIAREMGLPCVVNTRIATAAIRTGDLLAVDGTTGAVRVVERAAPGAPAGAPGGDRSERSGGAAGEDGATPGPDTGAHGDREVAGPAAELELAVLRVLGLKGRVRREALADVLGLSPSTVGDLIDAAVVAGEAKDVRDASRITPQGRERVAALLGAERRTVDGAALAAAYDRFHEPNDELKVLMTRWQTRAGEANDHTDPGYDAGVADEILALHERTRPLIDELVDVAPRLRHYLRRFARAADAIRAREYEHVANPLIDSFHTVWFELHEDLIGLLGRTREDEARAGRAA